MAAQGGVFTRAQALTSGVSEDEVNRALESGAWRRLRRGAYAEAEVLQGLSPRHLHVLALRAFVLQATPPVVASHETAAAVLGLEVWQPSYDWLNVTRPGRSSRREGGVWHHRAALAADEVTTVDGLTVTSVLRTGVDIARRVDFEHGVVVLDSALRLSGASLEQLREVHFRCVLWAGARTAGRAVAFADPCSGSVGESRARVLLDAVGLPTPETQVGVLDERGQLVGVVDFLIEGKTVVEFDGSAKYRLEGLQAEPMAERLWREKEREDTLRRLGYEVVRIVWADLYRPDRVAAHVRAAMARAAVSPPVRGRALAA